MEKSVAEAPPVPRHRFLFIDGLRGIAAMGVVVLHLLREPLSAIVPSAGRVAGYGGLGVTVFFVISGFVISHTLARAYMTPATVGRFLLRRVARLDPPYWASIALTVLVVGASARAFHHPFTFPSAGAIGAHVLYLQYILGIDSISDVYWTLCLEIQFYLLLALLLGVKQRLERRIPEEAAFAAVFWVPLLASLLAAVNLLPTPRGSCFAQWYAFGAGVAVQRVVAGRSRLSVVVAVAVALVIAVQTHAPFGLVAATTAVAITIATTRQRLDSWLAGPAFQFLGRISYSLYLIHYLVGARAMNVINHFVPARPWPRLGSALLGVGVAIVAADLFWRAIERPSIELSRWLGTLSRQVAPRGRPASSARSG